MIKPISLLCLLSLAACTSVTPINNSKPTATASNIQTSTTASVCKGTTDLPESIANQFTAIEDEALKNQALGEPNKGGLCEAQVYQAKDDIALTLYRAWNSTNPNSKMGKWWALEQPSGAVAQYREDYEICYQWSALDVMVSCNLKAGAKVVVGGGQSAQCSEYLNYDTSTSQQFFISGSAAAMSDCKTFEGYFDWR